MIILIEGKYYLYRRIKRFCNTDHDGGKENPKDIIHKQAGLQLKIRGKI